MKTVSQDEQSKPNWKITPRIVLDQITNNADIDLRYYNGGYYFYNKDIKSWDNRGIYFIECNSQKITDIIKYKDKTCSGDITNNFVKEIFGFIKRRYSIDESELNRDLVGVKNGILNTKTRELIPSDNKTFLPVCIIAAMAPEFTEYRDPFVGGGSVYFANRQLHGNDKKYWINDLSYELYNFWDVCQQDTDFIINKSIEWRNKYLFQNKDNSKGKELHRFLRRNLGTFDNKELAAAYFILNRIVFAGGTLVSGVTQQHIDGFRKLSIREHFNRKNKS